MVQFNRFIINIALSLVSVNAITHLLKNLPLDMLPTGGLPLDGLPLDSLPLDGLPLDSLPIDGLPLDDLPVPLPGHGHSEDCLGLLGGVENALGLGSLLGCGSSEQPEHHHHGHHGHHGHHHHHPGKSEEEHIKENIDFTFHENISEDELSK